MLSKSVFNSVKKCVNLSLINRNISVSSIRANTISEKNVAVINASILEAEKSSKTYCDYADATVKRWEVANETYYGKERDMVNFPDKIPESQPKMRYFLRESWFDAFYEKTGASGAYVFLAVPMLALISKELLVPNGEFGLAIIRGIAVYYVYQKYSPRLHKWLDDQIEPLAERNYYGPINKMKSNLLNTIATADENIQSNAMVPMLFEAKKENLQLQQEVIYRDRLLQVHKAVKQQLDYMVMHESLKRRTQHTHMVDWVLQRAKQSITPQMEKDVLASCILQLKQIAQTQNTAKA